MFKRISPSALSALALISTIGIGCGSQNAPSVTPSAATAGDAPSSESPLISAPGKGVPPYTFEIQGKGYDSHSFTVIAGSVLKVKFTPGTANTATGLNYTMNYSKLGVVIQVGSTRQSTSILNNGFNGGAAETSALLDFSGAFTKSCPAADPACRQQITLTVSQPDNDDQCMNAGRYTGAGCPYTRVPTGHAWSGTFTVQTDDTDEI